MKQLFDFQQDAVKSVLYHINTGTRRILMISLMGSGKTVMAAWLINHYLSQNKRCLFLVDLNVLIRQIGDELNDWKIPFTILQSGYKYDPSLPVVIASAQTIDSRLKTNSSIGEMMGSIDLIIVDEAHNLSYRKAAIALHDHYMQKETAIVGLTATPYRLNPKEYLGQWYDQKVVTLQPPDLIKSGRALPCRIYGFEDYFDLDTITLDKDGDYNEQDMAAQATQAKSLRKVFDEWQRLTPGHQTIAFCATVKHAIALADFLNEQGVAAKCITGDTGNDERLDMFKQLGTGAIKVLTSINTLTAGFNAPIVSCILYIRLTKSKAMYHQIIRNS